MFKNIRNLMVGLLASATLLAVPLAVPVMTSADNIQNCLSAGTNVDSPQLDQVGNGASCSPSSDQSNPGTKLNSLIKNIINIFSIIVGVVAVIMIIIGGFRYITSGGDSNNVSSAKNTIIYAIIGLVIVALAQFIVKFVLDKVTNNS